MMRLGWTTILLLSACRPTKELPPTPEPRPSASVALAVAPDASPPPEPEKPLTGGTRPSAKGPLFPIVDGTCQYAEVFPAGEHALLTFGRGSTAIVRVDDEGLVRDPKLETAVDSKAQSSLLWSAPREVFGTWPALVLYGNQSTRLRPQESLWTFGENGWTALEDSRSKEEPLLTRPVIFKGRLVTTRAHWVDDHTLHQVMKSWPVEKGAPEIGGLASLLRPDFQAERLEASAESIYAFGDDRAASRHVVRVLTDGKVVEAATDSYDPLDRPRTHRLGSALIEVRSREAFRWDGAQRKKLPIKLAAGATITGSAVAANGDLWVATSKAQILVLHDGAVTETILPAPAKPNPKEIVASWPVSGHALAGVEIGDPWAIGENGALYHFENATWSEVELPAPPFATTGKYQAQAILEKTKGDLFVNAGYAEKGPGWKSAERYRAILRQKRPKEIFRCEDPPPGVASDRAPGFSSSPPHRGRRVPDAVCHLAAEFAARLSGAEEGDQREPRRAGRSRRAHLERSESRGSGRAERGGGKGARARDGEEGEGRFHRDAARGGLRYATEHRKDDSRRMMMRFAVCCLPILLIGCRPKPAPKQEPVPAASSAAIALVDAAPPPRETPLGWGTRPSEKGPLFPVVDGMCIHGEIRPAPGKVLYTYGNDLGAHTRGGRATYARLEDDGLVRDEALERPADPDKAEAWQRTTPSSFLGAWPNLVLYSSDSGGGRTRSFESIWQQSEKGWVYRAASMDEKDEPGYDGLVLFKGWLVALRQQYLPSIDYGRAVTTIKTWPLEKDPAPVAGLDSLARADFTARELEVAGESIYAFGYEQKGDDRGPSLVRVLNGGKVTEGKLKGSVAHVIGARGDSLFAIATDDDYTPTVRRFDGIATTILPFEIGNRVAVTGSALAPNGDVWIETEKNEVMVLHGDKVTTTKLPAPRVKRPKDESHHRASGGTLAGVEFDDPYAIGDSGALFHYESGEWREVEMPRPPFATVGQYQAQSIVMPAKGDLMVNAGYAEKGIGWKTPERYRALLRTRRPKEVLRCNEPVHGADYESGTGFASSPPTADDTCQTPFVLILRLGSKTSPSFLYDVQGKFPTLRAALKETPGFGPTAEILEIPWGNIQAIGLEAPDMATAKALAQNAVKRVKSEYLETRPEILCGVPPTVDKRIHVDVATAKVIDGGR